jgi:hypothetical protein
VGEAEAGVDLASLGPEDVEVDGETATIRLPEPEVLSSSLDEEKTAVYDRDQGSCGYGRTTRRWERPAGTRRRRSPPPRKSTVS